MKQRQEFLLTSEGFLELETELNYLKNEERPRIIEAIKEATSKLQEKAMELAGRVYEEAAKANQDAASTESSNDDEVSEAEFVEK